MANPNASFTLANGQGSYPLSSSLQGIKACLDQLYKEALAHELPLVSCLIGAASEAISDEIVQRNGKPAEFHVESAS